ncbi:MAG: hypothetical protein KatS3mg031_2709 [Chitinophagales bacterium]|nr:MAG: hypothetical protein KatS3mg031_2709 [Chitinophagales bacterium]
MEQNFEQYLQPGKYIDSDHPEVRAFAFKHKGDSADLLRQAVSLYYAVRDGFIYDPFHVDLSEEHLKASALLARGRGFCVEKAALLAACARVIGIPSRIGLADVRNHLGAERLQKILQSDVFACHGFTELFLEGRWVKATPAFNKSLCEKLGVNPLEFDGKKDSIFQEYDGHNGNERKFMEYLTDHGSFSDVPRAFIIQTLHTHYPHLFEHPDSEAIKSTLHLRL